VDNVRRRLDPEDGRTSIYWLFTVGLNSSIQQKKYVQAYFRTDKHLLYSEVFYRMHIEWNTKRK